MVLETHMKLCVTESDFPGKFFFNHKNGPKKDFFEFIEKLSHEFFLNLVYKEIFTVFLHKSYTRENSDS